MNEEEQTEVLDLPNDTQDGQVDGDSGADGGDETSELSAAVAALGLTRMSLQELKDKSPADLLSFAETLEIENANSMRKQDMMFAI
ncbi:Rho termination factor N-terminal domain-containing protein, partial [Phenylobacterium sp.]|uniref:Rho termination factor N-terminal domain-containing protein n=1 Tax=Phenylobacterium sp. TaxID=1871053 RepID=UPI00273532EB